jgi:cysteine-rich repeat protein
MPSGSYVDIVHTGGDVTVSWTEGMTPIVDSGTFDQTWLVTGRLRLKSYGEGATLDGLYTGGSGFSFFSHRRLTRCECYDANATNGDGCTAECQIEPCFTCTPEPSVCSPSADAAACDDRNDCTTGEACSAGVCSNGSAVDPCVNLSGDWRLLSEDVATGDRFESVTTFVQRNGVVYSTEEIGVVDSATGVMDLVAYGNSGLCSIGWSFDGTATLDGRQVSGTGNSYFAAGLSCYSSDYTALYRRCDAAAGCNLTDCTGKADGTPCDTGEECVVSEVCQSGSCTSEPKCQLCESCVGSSCEIWPRPNCHQADSTRFQIVDKADDAKDLMRWSWTHGEPFDMDELDPTGPNDLALCVFYPDAEAGYRVQLPSDAPCLEPPCWTGSGDAYKYRNDAASSAFTSLSLKTGDDGNSRIQVKAKGAKLSSEPPPPDEFPPDIELSTTLPAAPLPLPLIAQLQSSTGTCFIAGFHAGNVTRNTNGIFKGKE